MTLAEKILAFQKSLRINAKLPKGVGVMNPYQDDSTFNLCEAFYKKFYSDQKTRTLILGINPGRFGGGITGIPFTDPMKLETVCGIANAFPKKTELSAEFIYTMIAAFGGPAKFYEQYYISSISPLGFTREGKNLNYYDDKKLELALEKFVVTCLDKQLSWGLNRDVCFCLGEGQNFKYLTKLNHEQKYFKQIIPLAHPRFIMQYRRKTMDSFVRQYVQKLSLVAQ